MNRVIKLETGFTLVELITVILLLGVLSAVAVARGLKPNDFEPRQIASLLAEQYRFAHALSTASYGDSIDYSITESAGTWSFVTASVANGEARREDVVANSISLAISNAGTSADIDAANGLVIEFSTNGDLLGASIGATALQADQGIEIRVTGDSVHELCIYPTGYIGSSACE